MTLPKSRLNLCLALAGQPTYSVQPGTKVLQQFSHLFKKMKLLLGETFSLFGPAMQTKDFKTIPHKKKPQWSLAISSDNQSLNRIWPFGISYPLLAYGWAGVFHQLTQQE